MTATNPWFRPNNPYSVRQFNYPGRCLFTYRGVEVYKNPAGSWDYILDGVAITQRAGFSADKAPAIIDAILDGDEYTYCADAVCEHLRAHGFQPQAYP